MDYNQVNLAIAQFHFIRPDWLWGIPVAIFLWFLLKDQGDDKQWSSHIPKQMLAALQVSSAGQATWWKWSFLLMLIGIIIAAAGPSWDKQAAPTIQNQKALVLVLDLSPSMLAQDLSPDRLTRAKYKLIDMLRQQGDGQAALIAYAGDAHTVSPLTDDPRTIEALLPALHPNVMPSRGSNTEAAIELAQQLMKDAGLQTGDILLISDGIADQAIDDITDSANSNYRLSVLAVGGSDPAPIPASGGGFVRKSNGEIVLSAVNTRKMRSMASSLGGRFSSLTSDDSDIQTLLINDFDSRITDKTKESDVVYDAWVDMGHWLVLLMLPFALVLFRKGAIYLLPMCMSLLLITPSESYAADFSWKDLWQTKDQQARYQFESGEFENAAKTFERKDWAAVSSYKNGAYDKTIDHLSQFTDAKSLYNKGNALALNGQLEEAIEAYEQVLEQQEDHADAAYNKSIIEQLMQQQEQNSDQNQNQNKDEGDQQSEDQQAQNSDDSQQQSEDQSKQSQKSGDQSDGRDSSTQSQQQPQQDQQSQSSNSEESQKQNESDESVAEHTEKEQSDEEAGTNGEQANAQEGEENGEPTSDQDNQAAAIEETNEPLKDTSEQWLRSIQDDPSGLLRRKFDYQARQRAQQRKQKDAAQERY